jgi:3-dehydroquinate synthase/2-deoxy-scyllo-inosose synthase
LIELTRLTLGDAEVPYYYGADCATELADTLAGNLGDVDGLLLVVDRHVTRHARTMADRLRRHNRVEMLELDAVECNKTISSVEAIMEYAVRRGLTRNCAVAAMGGGTVGNVAGLAAALLYRGVPLVHLPTTPVAAFDSVVSLKQGVNLYAGKNLCGTYHRPTMILCDLRWLTTVPADRLRTGMAEMAKNVLVTAAHLEDVFVSALTTVRQRPVEALGDLLGIGIDAKAPYLRDDPTERSAAILFEYGHTVGHAIEFTSSGAVGHGEAVAWGMLVAAEVSRVVTGLDDDAIAAHRRVIGLLDLPDPADRFGRLDATAIRAALAADNKRGYARCRPEEIPMVLLESLGRPLLGDSRYPLVPVPEAVVMDALAKVAA